MMDMMELKGAYNLEDPPLPIPNREVKLQSADGTARRWESRSAPDLKPDSISVLSGFF